MPVSSLDPRIVANAVLERAERHGVPLTNLDMQKIVYFLHGEALRKHGIPLVTGAFEAWTYGPVHKVLYDAFRRYGDREIEEPARRYDPIRRTLTDFPPVTDADTLEFLDSTLNRYLSIPTFILVQMTHAKGTPWSRTMEAAEQEVNVGMVISNSLIAEHFEGGSPAPGSRQPTPTRKRRHPEPAV